MMSSFCFVFFLLFIWGCLIVPGNAQVSIFPYESCLFCAMNVLVVLGDVEKDFWI